MQTTGNERGYLHERFRLFHTVDLSELRVDWHFHTFDKLVFFLSGHVEYTVESESAILAPGDLLTIAHGQLHRMRAWADQPYERYILYLDSEYLRSLAPEAGGLNACFQRARASGHSLIKLSDSQRAGIHSLLMRLEQATREPSPYAPALSQALLTELLVYICQLPAADVAEHPEARSDSRIAEALHYIQGHLGENLSCDALAKLLHMSRSSFQHRFKTATGRSPHAYIRLKRLLYASELLSGGMGAMEAGKKSGYRDHSAFCNAFYEQFGATPSAFDPTDGFAGPKE